ncbi:MAG: hypothetical protein K2Q24_01490 [Chitinophagaceae bacterium]|nr:hypothetical protein [Chitinophagaceae bacterium]
MKAILYTLILCSSLLTACQKQNDNNTTNVDLTAGTWRVSYYWDEKDETSDFASYNFMFLSNGTFMAHTSSGAAITGTWSQTSTKLIINFTDPLLSELNDDWMITEKTSTSLKLKDDNPAQDDQLHFTKN